MPELTIRPLAPSETGLFFSYPYPRVPGLPKSERDYAALLATGEHQLKHAWTR